MTNVMYIKCVHLSTQNVQMHKRTRKHLQMLRLGEGIEMNEKEKREVVCRLDRYIKEFGHGSIVEIASVADVSRGTVQNLRIEGSNARDETYIKVNAALDRIYEALPPPTEELDESFVSIPVSDIIIEDLESLIKVLRSDLPEEFKASRLGTWIISAHRDLLKRFE